MAVVGALSGAAALTLRGRSAEGPTNTTPARRTTWPSGVAKYVIKDSARVWTEAGQEVVRLQAEGPLELQARTMGDRTVVRVVFTGTMSVHSGGVDATAASLGDHVERAPFFLEFDGTGRFVGGRGSAKTSAFLARVWSSLGESLQFVPGPSGSARWESSEHDQRGDFTAVYEPTPTSVAKTKSGSDGYRAIYEFDEAGAIRHLLTVDKTTVQTPEKALSAFRGETSLELTLDGVSNVPLADWSAELAEAVSLGVLATRVDRHGMDAQLISSMSYEEALKALSNAGDDADAGDRAGQAFMALTAWLRRDPNKVADARAHILAGGPLTRAYIAALRDASTPESKRALADLAKQTNPGLPGPRRLEVTQALSHVPQPDAVTVSALTSLRSDAEMGTQATYGLGSALHRLQGQDPSLAASVRTTLLAQLASGQEVSSTLTALGNAGDPATLEAIRPYVADPSPGVRAAAAQALRRIAGADADELLAILAADADASVRFSAVDAIAERQPTTVVVAALSRVAKTDPVFQPRARAVNTLASWLTRAPAAAEALAYVAKNDSSEDLRHTAGSALSQHG
jgi:HEAT repeat protein